MPFNKRGGLDREKEVRDFSNRRAPSPEQLSRIVSGLGPEVLQGCDFPAAIFSKLVQTYLGVDKVELDPMAAMQCETVEADDREITSIESVLANDAFEAGQLAYARGEIAVVLLCGGMATRFGSSVKALAEVVPGKRFIEVALERIHALNDAMAVPVPIVVVTSAATHRAITDYVHLHCQWACEKGALTFVKQRVFPRLRGDGSLMTDPTTNIFYPPGHGDVLTSLLEQRTNLWLADRGVKRVITWGIDNPLAGPNFAVATAHVQSRKPLTVEVVMRRADDRGGQIIRCNGRIEIIEDFRLQKLARTIASPLLNTNSMVIDIEILNNPPPLMFFPVTKKLHAESIIQFERLLGELTHYVDSHFLMVSRSGISSRFAPIKTPADLEKSAAELKARIG